MEVSAYLLKEFREVKSWFSCCAQEKLHNWSILFYLDGALIFKALSQK